MLLAKGEKGESAMQALAGYDFNYGLWKNSPGSILHLTLPSGRRGQIDTLYQ
jgi:hypothetical protein